MSSRSSTIVRHHWLPGVYSSASSGAEDLEAERKVLA
jgi:hypothetical protein